MPAGIIKTPTSARAKEPNASKSAEKNSGPSSSGKKLVQTRLPFKLIAPLAKTAAAATTATIASPAASGGAVVDIDGEEWDREPRKRKLSYDCEKGTEKDADVDVDAEQLRRSNSKENLGVAEITPSKKSKTADGIPIYIIDIDDDIDDDELLEQEKKADSEEKKPIEGVTHQVPIQIKLPISNRRSKRRKPLKKQLPLAKERSDSSDDIEAIAVELNPLKRPKVLDTQAKAAAGMKAKQEESKTKDQQSLKSEEEKKTTVQVKKQAITKAKEAIKPKENIMKPKANLETKVKETPKSIHQLNVDEPKSDVDSKMDVDSDVTLQESSDSEANKREITVLSSTDADMDVDTDTLNKTSPEKDQSEEKSAGSSACAVVVVADKLQNLTPKQQKLMEQRRKAREEKERKLQEERRLKQLEKEQREQQKKSERDQKEEQRRKEREDKEQVKRQEREERERKRQAEVDSKNEEKRKRNEAKEEVQRKKDEERRRKEQEKEEAEQKKKRAAASFTKFFVPKQPKHSSNNSMDHDQNSCDSGPSQSSSQTLAFRPFQIKDDMIMAPIIRATIASDTRQLLDSLFYMPDDDEEAEIINDSIGRIKKPTRAQLYLNELNLGRHKPLSSKRDIRFQRRAKDEEEDDDVQVVDELANAGTPIVEERPKQLPWTRAKYLHFADNRRPPYYGTWRKRSQLIGARRPLGQDKNHFDYEVDSDCEWEEEEPGESLSASEDEKERESEEESEEEYNEWFVPHGHLSDEELQNDDELEDGNTREAQKAKLQVIQQEFAQEMKKQTKKIKPRLLGPVWLDEDGNKSLLCPAIFTQTIDMYGCWQLQPLTLEPPPEPAREEESAEEGKSKPTTLQLDDQLLQQLVHLIHGNRNAKAFLISEYLEYLKMQIPSESQMLLPPKTLLREKFDEMATWKPIELTNSTDSKKSKKPKKRLCWVVTTEMLQKYNLEQLTLQNQWTYTLTPKRSETDTSIRETTPPLEIADVICTPKSDISKFAKRNESAPQTPTTSIGSPATAPSITKKRGTLLMSVPRDQQFHAPTKNALISQYLRKQNEEPTDSKKLSTSTSPTVSDDVVLLSD